MRPAAAFVTAVRPAGGNERRLLTSRIASSVMSTASAVRPRLSRT
jgi:hypothetical protein